MLINYVHGNLLFKWLLDTFMDYLDGAVIFMLDAMEFCNK